eukprot:9185585-Ditylum_brightwellii.AAC.1
MMTRASKGSLVVRDEDVQKGDAVCFYSGVYEGKVGWLNSGRHVTGNFVPVFADMGGGIIKKATVSAW